MITRRRRYESAQRLLLRPGVELLLAGGGSYYDCDADGKRVSQRTADGFRQFVYQGPDMLKLQMERDESEETVAHYTMGAGLEAMRRDSASSFYHYNHLGTTLALTSADEAVTDTYRHDAWGVLLASTGSTVNPHTYVGRERYYRMPNAAMYHLGFRDYAQGLGRFTRVDPLPFDAGPRSLAMAYLRYSGSGPYVYVHNRPPMGADAIGLYAGEGPGGWPAPLKCAPVWWKEQCDWEYRTCMRYANTGFDWCMSVCGALVKAIDACELNCDRIYDGGRGSPWKKAGWIICRAACWAAPLALLGPVLGEIVAGAASCAVGCALGRGVWQLACLSARHQCMVYGFHNMPLLRPWPPEAGPEPPQVGPPDPWPTEM